MDFRRVYDDHVAFVWRSLRRLGVAESALKDAVQEVRTTVVNTDAGFGHTRGGTINMVMKSGTNELHGSLWENMQPSNLTANSFFNNAKGLGNPLTHYNQYGLTAGGPVWIPKVFNGKDKLFWFFAWQNDKNTQPFTTRTTIIMR